MRAVVQRVLSSSVSIGGEVTASIEKGLMVLVGVEVGDTEKDARYIADKCVGLRVFDDENGVPNRSVGDVGGSILAVSGIAACPWKAAPSWPTCRYRS